MPADRGVIFCIAIACVVICSTGTDIGENNNGMCRRNISYLEPQKIYYTVNVQKSGWFSGTYFETQRVYNITYVKKWGIKYTCCENYNDNSGTCKPQCSSPCTNGYCAQPDICECNFGWSGDMCNVSLLCIVNANSTTAIIKPSALQNVPNISKNSNVEPMRPACHSRCQENFNSTDAVNTTRFADGQIQYLIPINSPCNSVAGRSSTPRKYSILVGACIGFLLFAVIFYILYIVQKKRQARAKIANKLSDQPKSYVCADYIEENPIYS